MRFRLLFAAAALLLTVAGLAQPAAAETTATIVNGNKLRGTVPPGEVIRLKFPLAKDSEPRLTFTLSGSRIPVSFNRSDIIAPDGQVIPDTSRFFEGTRVRPKSSSLKMKGFVAPESGMYQLIIETNAGGIQGLTHLDVSGKMKVKRPKKIRVELNETDLRLDFGMKVRDRVKVKVKRIDGATPFIDKFIAPQATLSPVPQSTKKKGGTSQFFTATRDDVYAFEFGYRDGTVGTFNATLRVQPFKSNGLVNMRLANAPGIPLSVRPPNAALNLSFGTGAPGVCFDGVNVFITALRNPGPGADVAGRLYDRNLFAIPGTTTPVSVVGPADMQPGASIGSHRLVYAGGHYVVGWVSASGNNAGLARSRASDLQRADSIEIVVNAADDLTDSFLATDGVSSSFGIWSPPDGHAVWLYNGQFELVGTIDIGGGAFAHANGAGAAWDFENEEFEFWAPDALTASLPSNLHRQHYGATWGARGVDETPVADPNVIETMSTGVAIDPVTGATIIHYVVPMDVTGNGEIHQRVFDSDGVEVPDSHVVLSGTQRNRPTTIIVGDSLYLASETAGKPLVERFPLLR